MATLTYAGNKETKLCDNPTITVEAFAGPRPYNGCNCPNNVNGKFEYDKNLFKKISQLFQMIGGESVMVTSGYRSPGSNGHDKHVGGDGQGQHTKGKAVDIVFYKNGSAFDTRILSCIAQDVGFSGIARIDSTAIHLDVRDGKYFGDETVNWDHLTEDFYKYYDLKKSDVEAYIENKDVKIDDIEIKDKSSSTGSKKKTVTLKFKEYISKYTGDKTSAKEALIELGLTDKTKADKYIEAVVKVNPLTETDDGYSNEQMMLLLRSGKLRKP